MTTLENRPNTALLVIDVQNGVVGGASERDTVVANVGTVVEKARAAEVPVVWVQHSSVNLAQGSAQWKIVPELSPDEREPLVQKRYPDLFEETTLESGLVDLAVGASSSLARRRTNAYARRCTAHSFAAMTRRSSAMRTRPRISRPGALRRRNSSLRTQISTGVIMRLRGGRPARSKRRSSSSQRPDDARSRDRALRPGRRAQFGGRSRRNLSTVEYACLQSDVSSATLAP